MRKHIKTISWVVGVLIISALLIGFESVESNSKVCNDIIITIDNQLENHFVDDNDIVDLITLNGTEIIEGAHVSKLNLREIEQRLVAEPFLNKAEIYVDHSGNMMVHVGLRKPMARVVRYNGPDAYIGEDGQVLPVSTKYSRRAIIITGEKSKELSEQVNITEGEYSNLYKLIQYIVADEFLKAQIAQIKIIKNGEVILYPQITKQYIEFGKIEDIETKFKKLRLFYDEILPRNGWNSYSRVNLKYKNQIICE
ncbi:Cell division protein FtsQ [hydrothermal vent metagenome]|uniref:Cell division protein FtsQ n=1 Tax=hydrothermal vent metagenome TaxID=652676 RepID=A0A3B0VA58_9ZZZZ